MYEAIPNDAHHVQVGVVRGGIGECGDVNFPDIYIRLDDHEILSWIYRVAFGKRISKPSSKISTTSSKAENCKSKVL